MEKQIKIYRIVHISTGRCYIGQTSLAVQRRWRIHVSRANRGSPYHLHCAIREYGLDVFSITCIETCPDADTADAAEKRWIVLYDSVKNGFNETSGGRAWNKGLTKSTDARIASMKHPPRITSSDIRLARSERMIKSNPMRNPDTVAKVLSHPSTPLRRQRSRLRMLTDNPMKTAKNRDRMRNNNPNASGNTFRGKHLNDAAKESIRRANLVRVCCYACHLEGGIAAMKRYHIKDAPICRITRNNNDTS